VAHPVSGPPVPQSFEDYLRAVTTYVLTSAARAVLAAACVMAAVFVAIWAATGDAPGRLLCPILGVATAGVVLLYSSKDVPFLAD
jgi:di/tricarboxylate transporter